MGFNLPILNRIRRKGVFSPAQLFKAGDILLWYDPSDLSTMFQDVAGTSPVTADGQSVALMLDKGQWGGKTLAQVLAAQPELVTNGDFDDATGWTLGSGWAVGSGVLTGTSIAVGGAQASFAATIVAGRAYCVTYTITAISANGVSLQVGGTNGTSRATSGTYTEIITATNTTAPFFAARVGTTTVSVDNVSVKEIPGYHRTQATPSAAPKYKTDGTLHWLLYDGTDDSNATGTIPFGTVTSDGAARRNLLVNPSQFDHTTWTKVNCAVSAGVVTTSSTADGLNQAVTSYTANAAHSQTWRVAAGTATWLRLVIYQTSTSANRVSGWFNLSTGAIGTASNGGTGTGAVISATEISAGVYDVTLSGAVGNSTTAVTTQISTADADTSTTGVSGVTYGVQRAQLELGSSATAFQNIGTDEVAICAGVTKSSDAASGMFMELSATTVTNNGGFYLTAPELTGASGDYRWKSRGTLNPTPSASGTLLAPRTDVVTGAGKIGTDLNILRVNGAQVGTTVADQGTGNFGDYPLFFGRRNNTSVPFNGREHQTIIRSRLLSASELAKLEAFVAAKTGVIL